jgi:hypothetical protein
MPTWSGGQRLRGRGFGPCGRGLGPYWMQKQTTEEQTSSQDTGLRSGGQRLRGRGFGPCGRGLGPYWMQKQTTD